MRKGLIGLLSVFSLSVAFMSSGCYYDNEEYLYGVTTCDTTTVNYTVVASAINNNGCLSCHSNTTKDSGGGYDLEGYNDLKSIASSDNLLYKAVTHDSTVSAMPPTGTKISDCDIAKIAKWASGGYAQ